MAGDFKRGDQVEWNSEAGRVRGTVQKKVTREITFKGYKRHASEEEPQYIIKSDKTDHLRPAGSEDDGGGHLPRLPPARLGGGGARAAGQRVPGGQCARTAVSTSE